MPELRNPVQYSQHQFTGIAKTVDPTTSNLVAIDLTGSTLELHIQFRDGTVVELSATPGDQQATLGSWTCDPPDTSTISVAGRCTLQLWVTNAEGKTFPAYAEEREVEGSVKAS